MCFTQLHCIVFWFFRQFKAPVFHIFLQNHNLLKIRPYRGYFSLHQGGNCGISMIKRFHFGPIYQPFPKRPLRTKPQGRRNHFASNLQSHRLVFSGSVHQYAPKSGMEHPGVDFSGTAFRLWAFPVVVCRRSGAVDSADLGLHDGIPVGNQHLAGIGFRPYSTTEKRQPLFLQRKRLPEKLKGQKFATEADGSTGSSSGSLFHKISPTIIGINTRGDVSNIIFLRFIVSSSF